MRTLTVASGYGSWITLLMDDLRNQRDETKDVIRIAQAARKQCLGSD